MAQLLRKYRDGSFYVFDNGNFDEYRVTFYANRKRHVSLRDCACLARLARLGRHFGNKLIYQFFSIVFTLVSDNAEQHNALPQVNRHDLLVIHRLASCFAGLTDDQCCQPLAVEKLFDYFYFAMVSECHHPYTKLYHRIKRLAVYQVLLLGMSPIDASVFSRGKNAHTLEQIMDNYHI